MSYAEIYAQRKDAGLCGRCAHHPLFRGGKCKNCWDKMQVINARRAIWLAEYDRKRSEKIRLRTGTTTRDAEWRIREIEEQLKWNAEHIHTEAK